MKRRIYTAATLIALALSVAAFLCLKNRAPIRDTKSAITLKDVADAMKNPSSLLPEGVKNVAREHQAQKDITQAVEGMNKPVSLHGRVVDQNDAPVSGAKVSLSVRHWDPSAPNRGGSIPVTLESDLAGLFHLGGVTGDAIGVDSMGKPGYELEPIPRNYGAIAGSVENPITFRMWSTNVHEQLITGNKSFHIIPDGRSYIINLTNGIIADSGEGDLKVCVKRPDSVQKLDRYDWSCGIEVLNGGGLVEDHSPDGAMFYAPIDGYTRSFSFEQRVGSGWGDTSGPKRFYLSLNGGRIYGQMTIELFAYYNKQIPGMVRLSYATNPSGSRILK